MARFYVSRNLVFREPPVIDGLWLPMVVGTTFAFTTMIGCVVWTAWLF